MHPRDAEPGRLYAVTSWRGKDLPAFRTRRGDDIRWCVYDEGDTRGLTDGEVTDVRPLVVLDLADIDEDFAETWPEVAQQLLNSGSGVGICIADQVKAQTRLPKPPEPTGLGAVVKDREGNRWIRTAEAETFGLHWVQVGAQGGALLSYRNIGVVEVLSEGVTP
jgi:hypothetical protein